jgi:hypothetical protein
VLITSAACAVTIAVWKTNRRWMYMFVTLVFVYTTAVNIWERPEGLKISCFFIGSILFVSLVSRATRSTELRITGVHLSEEARRILEFACHEVVRVIPRKPRASTEADLDAVDQMVRNIHHLPERDKVVFLEVERTDASEFQEQLTVEGQMLGRHCVLSAKSPIVANAIAAILMELERTTGTVPHIYFKWKEGNPVANIFRFLFLGEGDAAPITHEVLRKAVPDVARRPIVHVS